MVRTCALIVLCALLYHGDPSDVAKTQTDRLLRELSGAKQLAGGRLAKMPYPGARSEQEHSTAPLDGRLLATDSNSASQRHTLSLIYALSGRLDKAEQVLRQLALELPNDAGIQNDLGVMRMGLAASDPSFLFTAIEQFELALAARPDFPEAKFNLILSYRHLGLRKLEASAVKEYQRIETEPAWRRLIGDMGKSEDETANGRQLVLDFAFQPVLPIPDRYIRIAQTLSDQYGDDTAKLALAALSPDTFDQIARARQLFETGHQSYLRGRFEESRTAYGAAKRIAGQTHSLFDQLWIEINDADAMVNLLDYAHAAKAYRHAAEISRQYRLQWLLARSLSSLGSAPALSGGIVETISRLNDAVQVYRTIGETKESARPLYYLAGYHFLAASFAEGLKYSLESLNAADPSDNLRLSGLHQMISRILLPIGYSEMAARFNEQAADYAEKVGNPRLIASMKVQLASLYLANARRREAIEQLKDAERALPKMSAEDRAITGLQLNLIRGRLSILSGNFSEAELELRENISFLSKNQAFNGQRTHAQSRMYLSSAIASQGRMTEAAQELREAIKLVEAYQDHLPTDGAQISFDQDRREIYEAAIAFEYGRSGCEEAWNLTQGYKAKLFLNLLNGFGPLARRLPTQRLTLPEVQRRIPNNVQIVDYVTLKDQLLVWVISKDKFQCRSVLASRHQLQEKIDSFLSQLRQKQPTEKSSQDLYDLLVQPVSEFLDSTRAVIIVPDGNLYRLPFAALQSGKDRRYWVEMTPIIESPSVTYLFSGSDGKSSNGTPVAFGSRTYDAVTSAELNAIREIEPAIRIEAGPEVTREAFLQALQEDSLLYYAGHSAFDMRNALQSSILLDGDKAGPNTVSALDIMQRRTMKNAMIILSSCETSLGNSIDGAGIGGLTSAFLVGGAGSVVGSIWPVESSSTLQLMSSAFEFLVQKQQSIADSLRAAQIRLIHSSTYAHPYYWSGFVVTGNLSATSSKR